MQPQNNPRLFLQKLLQNPPPLPFEASLLPMLFAATRDDSTATTADLVALIERSQKLTTRVLAIANSAAYGLEFKVSTLQRAILVLGLREIRLLAVSAGVASMLKDIQLPAEFNIAELWEHQLRVAVAAKTLAKELGTPAGLCGPAAPPEQRLGISPDEAYIAGLLHDIGKVFFVASRPDLWQGIEQFRKDDPRKYFEIENDYWGIDHALIGAEVLHSWNLPLLLTESINWHHAPELAPTFVMEARLLAAANLIAHCEADEEGGLDEDIASLLPTGCDTKALVNTINQNIANVGDEPLTLT